MPRDRHATRRARSPFAQLFSRNPFRRTPPPTPTPKPIYIYPGLLRIARDKAIALDNLCPAVLYRCPDCPAPPATDCLTPVPSTCSHTLSCSICLDDFHCKDLVRKLPCNTHHMFHSKCILDWFSSHQRCPLCNNPVKNTAQPISISDANSLPTFQLPNPPPPLPPHPIDSQSDIVPPEPSTLVHHARSFRSLPVITLDERECEPIRMLQKTPLDMLPNRSSSFQEPSFQERADPVPCDHNAKQRAPLPRPSARTAGTRTYSYIVHDNVRMQLMGRVIPP